MRLGLFRSATSVQLLEITVGAALMCVMAMILITSFIQQRIFPHIPAPTPTVRQSRQINGLNILRLLAASSTKR